MELQVDEAEPYEEFEAAAVRDEILDRVWTAVDNLADPLLDNVSHQGVAFGATWNCMTVVTCGPAIGQRDCTGEQIVSPEQPFGEHVLIVERLLTRLRSANEAAISEADVIDESSSAEEDDLAVLIDN